MDHCPEDHDLSSYGESVIAGDLMRECSVHSMCHFHTFVKVSFTGDIIQDDAAKVRKFVDDCYCCPVFMLLSSVACPGPGWMRIFIFLTLTQSICRPHYTGLLISGG